MKRYLSAVLIAACFSCWAIGASAADPNLEAGFQNPPPSARPWVYWFWINGNISKEGITADLEAMNKVGIGGVLWMEVSGQWWAPDGEVVPASPQWHEMMQWAIRECDRLGLEFDISVDFGYGSGGPHITPELSMQQLVWSETEVAGGKAIDVVLEKAKVETNVSAWLRPGAQIKPEVVEMLQRTDSYRDAAVVAIPLASSAQDRAWRIPDLDTKSGLTVRESQQRNAAAAEPPAGAVTPLDRVVDLTDKMDREGRLTWDAPAGKWLIIRYGHASNMKMTRPCPALAVGLECDRLARAGIEAHYEGFLKRIFKDAGAAAGRALTTVHIDSWEAGCQNWTATMPSEFKVRRGYDLRPWLPVLTGRVVGDLEQSERFLWDLRVTASEMTRDNYARRLKELARPHGIKLSIEAYGRLCIDNLQYGGVSDMPISEFWARGKGLFPTPASYHHSSKAMASIAHTYGMPVVGAEAFTSDRGWRDTPFTLKAMGDMAFGWGVNRFIFHLSAHQAYENMIPGLTHRKWGEHIQRHNTWWDYSRPWMEYIARSQYLLQQGQFVADVAWWFGEGAPLRVNDMTMEMPAGYDYDLCSSENVLAMRIKDGRLVLPSGASYQYLLLPDGDRMTAPMARKVEELVESGARVIGGAKPKAAPGLTDYPRCDAEVARIRAELWDGRRVIVGKSLAEVFHEDGLSPDFEGGAALIYHHRRSGAAELYFVANQENRPLECVCTFRVTGKQPELWNPETEARRALTDYSEREGRISVPLHFEPLQSWFVVFRADVGIAVQAEQRPNSVAPQELRTIGGVWEVRFDPKWGGPDKAVRFETLTDWSRHSDPRIHYYSGTATYRNTFTLSAAEAAGNAGRLWLDLGTVEVMGRVRVNGRECGVAWKPPYRVEITGAAKAGENVLEVDAVNLWINRMIGDEQLPEDAEWRDFETLAGWPEWFKAGQKRPSGRYTFTSAKHYTKDTPLVPSGLLGPVTLMVEKR
ncbi:MAG: hypothetical protein JXA69_08765 [Phycisphaerae bacterium]|nr:hypothetical protein [Phycisphaerae bacterium]